MWKGCRQVWWLYACRLRQFTLIRGTQSSYKHKFHQTQSQDSQWESYYQAPQWHWHPSVWRRLSRLYDDVKQVSMATSRKCATVIMSWQTDSPYKEDTMYTFKLRQISPNWQSHNLQRGPTGFNTGNWSIPYAVWDMSYLNRKRTIKQHIKYFNFRSYFQ